jgi:hypothetical protein
VPRIVVLTTALLTAAVMDVIGGVAKAELLDGQAPIVARLPGLLGIVDDGWTALGTAEFLRAWVGHPAFRLVKWPRQIRGGSGAVPPRQPTVTV